MKRKIIFLFLIAIIMAILIRYVNSRLTYFRMAKDYLSENYSFEAKRTGFYYNFFEDIYYVDFITEDLTPNVSFSVRIQKGQTINTTFECEAAKLRLNDFFQNEAFCLWGIDSRAITNMSHFIMPSSADIREKILVTSIEDILSYKINSFSVEILLENPCDDKNVEKGIIQICNMLEEIMCSDFQVCVFFSQTGLDNDYYYYSYFSYEKEFHKNHASERAISKFYSL